MALLCQCTVMTTHGYAHESRACPLLSAPPEQSVNKAPAPLYPAPFTIAILSSSLLLTSFWSSGALCSLKVFVYCHPPIQNMLIRCIGELPALGESRSSSHSENANIFPRRTCTRKDIMDARVSNYMYHTSLNAVINNAAGGVSQESSCRSTTDPLETVVSRGAFANLCLCQYIMLA